ncbi:MAG: hypothetical protein F4X14_16245 [Caldilineaceae bacterium SB0661_bin_32]|uniref:Uncharacterized protein n=1 Tax=Caldilineaceae bacterium SB0661_bin_32 TaxID=2605255 RepID=A0A6B1DA68_9CHLR|nr:hypothetical protein [Caldilineaceae bacterium SB0661_bin_32]
MTAIGTPPPFSCGNFTEPYWQEFRFGVDSPDEVIETVIKLWNTDREQIFLDELSREETLLVRWEDSQGERVYSARFREGEFHQVLVSFKSGRRPTLAQVIDCLGFPEYFAAYEARGVEKDSFVLALSYPEKGFEIYHVSFGALPKSTTDLPARLIDNLSVVAPGPPEQMVRDVYSYGHLPSVHAWGLCVLRPWPGSIGAIEIESFLGADPRCKQP